MTFLGHLQWQVVGSCRKSGGHFVGHSHLQVIKLRTFGGLQVTFLGHLHWQLAGSCWKGGGHLIEGHSQLQVFGLNLRGGKHLVGLHLGLHSQSSSSVMRKRLIPMGSHMMTPKQLNLLKLMAHTFRVAVLNGVHVWPGGQGPEHFFLIGGGL